MQIMQAAFRRDWPEVGTFNLLDESLYAEMDEAGTITPEIIRRIRLLFEYCVSARADAIVFTGSTFGPAVDVVRGPLIVPVVRADEALAEVPSTAVSASPFLQLPTVLCPSYFGA